MSKCPKRFVVLTLSACLTALLIQAAEKYPFAMEDSAALRSAQAMAIAADGCLFGF
jgi:hypothetical protein